IRTNWVRPDCNAEVARVLALRQQLVGDNRYQKLFDHITEWLFSVQDNDEQSVWHGSFPFYMIDGHIRAGESIYQNDNGKILISLLQIFEMTEDERFLQSALKLA